AGDARDPGPHGPAAAPPLTRRDRATPRAVTGRGDDAGMADHPPRSPLAARRLALGAAAEERAAAWYAARGWEVVARNWRCREGELDLVVARGSTLAFV